MQDIKDWLLSEKDYATGVSIFSKYCKNVALVRMLSGSAKNLSKLEYEMKKLLGIPLSALFTQKCSNKELLERYCKKKEFAPSLRPQKNITINVSNNYINNKDHNIYKTIDIQNNNIKNLDPNIVDIINTAKQQIKDLYTRIDMMHTELYNLGTSNDKAVVEQRHKILQERKPLIARCEQLYELKEEYFRTRVLSGTLKELVHSDIQKEPAIAKPSANKAKELSDLQLAKRRQQLRSSITKTENLINYQAVSKLSELRPMPEGPKRKDTEKRLADLKAEYTEIVTEISKRQ